jgi:hypothetical protein
MATCNIQTLLSNASCFACLSPGEWDVVELQLLCEILNAPGSSGLNIQTKTLAINSAATTQQTPHGLGRTPMYLYAVFNCILNDAASGYNAGAEVNINAIYQSVNPLAPISVWADATNINLSWLPVFSAVGIRLPAAAGGAAASLSAITNWQWKFYFA